MRPSMTSIVPAGIIVLTGFVGCSRVDDRPDVQTTGKSREAQEPTTSPPASTGAAADPAIVNAPNTASHASSSGQLPQSARDESGAANRAHASPEAARRKSAAQASSASRIDAAAANTALHASSSSRSSASAPNQPGASSADPQTEVEDEAAPPDSS